VIYAESGRSANAISPDAKWLVWVKSTGDKDKDTRVFQFNFVEASPKTGRFR